MNSFKSIPQRKSPHPVAKVPKKNSAHTAAAVKPRPSTPKKKAVPKNPFAGAEDYSGFGRLPVEIKAKIFRKFTFEQRKTLRLVCPGWLTIINETITFRASLRNPKGSWIPNCRNFQYLFVQNWAQEAAWIRGTPKCSFLREIEHLVIGAGNSNQNIILLLCTSVTKSLTLKNWALSQVEMSSLIKYLPEFGIGGVSKLSIGVGCPVGEMQRLGEYRQNLDALLFLVKSVDFPALSTLSVDIGWAWTNPANFKIPALDILSACFLGKYKKPIKEFNLFLTGDLGKRICLPTAPVVQEVKSYFSDLRLQKFELGFDKYNAGFASLILMTIHQPVSLKLKEIRHYPERWSPNNPVSPNCLISTKTILNRIGADLQELELRLMSFSFNSLEYFQCLESLTIRIQALIGNEFVDMRNRNPKLVLPTLKKFSIATNRHQRFEFWAEIRAYPERLIYRIAHLFPNIEEIELFLLGGYDISPRTVETTLRIPNIRRFRIGQSNFTSRFVNTVIMRFRNENGVTVQARGIGKVADVTEEKENTRQYHYVEFGIDNLKLPKYYRPGWVIDDGRYTA